MPLDEHSPLIETAKDKETQHMDSVPDLKAIRKRITALQKTAQELQAMGADLPCLARNTTRILASIKMLEIGLCEVADLEADD